MKDLSRIHLFFLIGIILLLSDVGCIHSNIMLNHMPITKEMAVEIANKKARELKYDIERMNIDMDGQNSKWNYYQSIFDMAKWEPELIAPLENKNYWAIYYQPRGFQKGGDLWVFIDKKSGEVITVIQGD